MNLVIELKVLSNSPNVIYQISAYQSEELTRSSEKLHGRESQDKFLAKSKVFFGFVFRIRGTHCLVRTTE